MKNSAQTENKYLKFKLNIKSIYLTCYRPWPFAFTQSQFLPNSKVSSISVCTNWVRNWKIKGLFIDFHFGRAT